MEGVTQDSIEEVTGMKLIPGSRRAAMYKANLVKVEKPQVKRA
jgi:hypothetical protein